MTLMNILADLSFSRNSSIDTVFEQVKLVSPIVEFSHIFETFTFVDT